jgi:hypothetical protein
MSGVLEYTLHLVFLHAGLCPQQLAPGWSRAAKFGILRSLPSYPHTLTPESEKRKVGFACSDHALILLDCHDQEKCEGLRRGGVDA